MTTFAVTTPLFCATVTTDLGFVVSIRLNGTSPVTPETDLERTVAGELHAYAAGQLTEFSFPIKPRGTDFQRRVWAVLQTIPWGEVRSYAQVAKTLGQPGAARAVGMANHHNPLPLVIPCHRVIASDGTLGGFGAGVGLKQRLLQLEGTWPDASQMGLFEEMRA